MKIVVVNFCVWKQVISEMIDFSKLLGVFNVVVKVVCCGVRVKVYELFDEVMFK